MQTRPTVVSTSTQALGTGALTHSYVVTEDEVELLAVMLAAASAISQVVTVSHVGGEGATYTFTLDTSTLSSATTYIFRPSGALPIFKKGDTIKLTCANSGTPAITVYSKIQYRPTN